MLIKIFKYLFYIYIMSWNTISCYDVNFQN